MKKGMIQGFKIITDIIKFITIKSHIIVNDDNSIHKKNFCKTPKELIITTSFSG